MKLLSVGASRGPLFAAGTLLAALSMLAIAVSSDQNVEKVAPLVVVAIAGALVYRTLLAWRTLLGALVLVILFIPIRRYTLPANLPFELEPYRLFVALIAGLWLTSLLIDPRVRIRRTGFEWPLFALVMVVLGSVIANGDRISALAVGSVVNKRLTFLASFFLVVYMIVSVIRRAEHRDFLIRVLVGGGAVVAVFSVIEARTGFNAFNHLASVVPLLRLSHSDVATALDLGRGGRLRVYASAQHPIALGAALVMILPLAIYLARATARRRWWIAACVVALGSLATLSRTAIVMLVVIAIVFLRHRPRETKRLWPALIPVAIVVHLALPGTIGTVADSFFPKGGLVQQQEKDAGSVGSGRVADLGPSLDQVAQRPLLGEGYGTRVVDGPEPNALILDDQWLDILLETGLAGAFAWLWLFTDFIRRLGRRAKQDPSAEGWLLTALVAAVSAYAVGMLTYDAMSFIQVTFLFFIMLGLGAAALSNRDAETERAGIPT
jgi:hypothetical protein